MSRSSLWTKTVALGLLVVASVIGNVSLSAANTRLESDRSMTAAARSYAHVLAQPMASADRYGGLGGAVTAPVRTPVEADASAVVAAHETPADESGQVVPAIYAWDPDVRFVFYRHVSKWM